MELRTTLCRNQISPSATVNTGLESVSTKYSPIKKVVACQLVMAMPNCWTNCCSVLWGLSLLVPARTMERNESTKTSVGLKDSTSSMMRLSTTSRSPPSVSSERLMNRMV